MIPNVLWQSWKTKTLPRSVKGLADSWTKSNTQLTVTIMDDQECSDFILEHFGHDVHKIYLSLPQNINRADFWRVAVVYIHGGYYSDLDVECSVPLPSIVTDISTVEGVFIKERSNIANFFFGAVPKHPVLKNALDMMIRNASDIVNISSQDFGMHPLHFCTREYYSIQETNYPSSSTVCFLNNEQLKDERKLIHIGASGFEHFGDYVSWRERENYMMEEREKSQDVLFFTTFNKNGYELYGKEWVQSFIKVANYYNKFKAKVYYEGFKPTIEHPAIEWIKYEDAITWHPEWKKSFLAQSTHADYVKTMTVRFSHKAFVIQHALDNNSNDYVIWLDGDCVFKNADFTTFPIDVIADNFLACQLEHAHDLNHIESGILIFNGKHEDTVKFNAEFKKWYAVENVLPMGQPYDGFLVFKTLLTSELNYTNLNELHGKGGIQSDPGMTFCHPLIASRFIHNIGWTGKNQYENWQNVFERDDVYQKMQGILFGNNNSKQLQQKKETAFNKLHELAKLRSKK